MLSTGLHIGWAGPGIHALTTNPDAPFKLPASQTSFLASILCLGAVIGAIITYYVAGKWSRSKLVSINALIFLTSACIYTFYQSLYPFYVARVLSGIGCSISFGNAPLYICEIASPKIRGTLCFILQGACACGGVLVYILIPFTSLTTFSTIAIGIAMAHLIFSIFLPESPYFLLLNQKQDQARNVLRTLRNKEDVTEELGILNGLVKDQFLQPKMSFLELFSDSRNRKGVLISCLMMVAEQACGSLALQAYSQSIFDTAALAISSDVCGIIYQAIGALTLLVSGSFIDLIGRRALYISSSVIVTLSLIVLGGYYYLQFIHILEVGAYPFVPLTFMVTHISGTAFGLVPLPYIISNELMSTSVRPLGGLMVTLIGSFSAAASLILFQILDQGVGKFAAFWSNAVMLVILVVMVLIYLPETKGKTLDQINIKK